MGSRRGGGKDWDRKVIWRNNNQKLLNRWNFSIDELLKIGEKHKFIDSSSVNLKTERVQENHLDASKSHCWKPKVKKTILKVAEERQQHIIFGWIITEMILWFSTETVEAEDNGTTSLNC